jgi:hypothetical protein
MRCLLASFALLLVVTALPAQSRVPGVQVLVVVGVDKPNERILFEAIGYQAQDVERNGKVTTEQVPVLVKAAFSLKEGKAITANGQAVSEADLWKRIKVGKPVAILSPEPLVEDLDKSVRALFKDDTLLLLGLVKPLPAEKAPKKP